MDEDKFWWLSFADGSLPEGSQFLGAAVVGPADNIVGAIRLAHEKKCNPGGEVLAVQLPDGCPLEPQDLGVLMSKPEAAVLEQTWGDRVGRKGRDGA